MLCMTKDNIALTWIGNKSVYYPVNNTIIASPAFDLHSNEWEVPNYNQLL